jgi:hypothetical protein
MPLVQKQLPTHVICSRSASRSMLPASKNFASLYPLSASKSNSVHCSRRNASRVSFSRYELSRDYKACIVLRRLQDLAHPLGSVLRAFEAHGNESVLEYCISANPYGDGGTNLRSWRLRRKRAASASKPYDSHLIQGPEAKRMLLTTTHYWLFYLKNLTVFRNSHILQNGSTLW